MPQLAAAVLVVVALSVVVVVGIVVVVVVVVVVEVVVVAVDGSSRGVSDITDRRTSSVSDSEAEVSRGET